MDHPLRLLLVADRDHARRLRRELDRAGFPLECERIGTPGGLVAALRRAPWDLAICQPELPHVRLPIVSTLLLEYGAGTPILMVDDRLGAPPAVAIRERWPECGVTMCAPHDLSAAVRRLVRQVRRARSLERARDLFGDDRCLERFERASDIVYAHDRDGVFTYVNRAVERLGGYRPADLIGRNFAEIVAPEDLETARRGRMSGAALEEAAVDEIPFLSKGGVRIPLEVISWLVVRDGVVSGIFGVARPLREWLREADAPRTSANAAQ